MNNISILTLEQAAEYLQIPSADLYHELESGNLPGRKIAGQWRIRRETLDDFLSQFESSSQLRNKQEVDASDTPAQAVQDSTTTLDTSTPSVEDGEENSTSTENLASRLTSTISLSESESAYSPRQDNSVQQLLPSASDPNRLIARVFSYNIDQGFGYAKTIDNKTIFIDAKYLLSKYPTPFPGEIVEFEWQLSRKGHPQPRAIRVLTKEEVDDKAMTTQKVVEDSSIEHTETTDTDTSETSLPIETRVPRILSVTPRPSFRNINGTREAQSLYQKAALANTEGRYDEARRLFKKALEVGAGMQAYQAFAKLEREKGHRLEAIRILRQAIDLFPNQASLYVMYGQIERNSRNNQRAEEIFRNGLHHVPHDVGLRMGLAQTLVQIGSEKSLDEAGVLFAQLERERKMNKSDGLYQRFQFLKRNPRANQVYDFFQTVAGMRVGIAGQKDLPYHITDIVVETDNQELEESFGLSGGILVRCFQRPARQAEIVNLKDYISRLRNNELVGLREGREVVLNRSLAFVAVPETSNVRDQIMSILSESSEAIVPIDDAVLSTRSPESALSTLRDLLGQYLGQRDLYNSTGPVYGVPGRRFFGRERLLVQLADDVNRGQFIGIYGLRKMGKTSLVYQLRDEKLSSEVVAYVDLQASSSQFTGNLDPVYYEIERDLYSKLLTKDFSTASILKLGQYERFTDIPKDITSVSLVFAEDIRLILDRLAQNKITSFRRVVIVLDELERILPVSGQTVIQGYIDFFGLIRGLMQTERYRGLLSSVVVAANASISERGYWGDRENPVFALYKTVFLPPFTMEECSEMVKTLGRGMSVRWDDGAIAAVFFETGGHPFLTRLFCSRIIQNHRSRPLLVTVDMVQEHVRSFIRSDSDKLEQITEILHRNFPEEEQSLLQIALDEAPNNLEDESLRHLLGYHLIQPEGNTYKVTLNLLRRWLRRRAGVKDE
ncbi:AAA-like domain-containing protein [Candidatus Chloroploca sp. M-50]|uniref:AAA-like domain-containing protein n=1 Tax=Candidatus Chloroploca mongolica TaxID=2528176 RepID=A0ABS4DDD2_9CHLR|nr:AAA-like domain-containing protein [Candidatus Chloroploca mongolica]MBP1467447.1 AAA-like domain-containing protein [Candidatus Chloroploca mongolica]